MTTRIDTAEVFSPAVELSRRTYLKQIIKAGALKYENRVITFDRPYFENVVRSFKERAYDAVPLQVNHDNDPYRSRGEVVGLEARDDGLYATIEVSQKGEELIKENPKIGVSVRLKEGYRRGDGESWPVALQHVALTWTPRISGMAPFQPAEAVALSLDMVNDNPFWELDLAYQNAMEGDLNAVKLIMLEVEDDPGAQAHLDELVRQNGEINMSNIHWVDGKDPVSNSAFAARAQAPRSAAQQQEAYRSEWAATWITPERETRSDGLVPISDPDADAIREGFIAAQKDSPLDQLVRSRGSRPQHGGWEAEMGSANARPVRGYRHANGDPVLGKDARPLWEKSASPLPADQERIYRNDERLAGPQSFIDRAVRNAKGGRAI